MIDLNSVLADLKANLNPYNIISTVIGVGGFVVSAISLYISRKHRSPKYMVRNSNIIGETTLDTQLIDIHYANKTIPVLSVCKVAFWNSGRVTLSSDDIAARDTIRIVASGDDVEILDYKLICENPVNDVALSLSPDKKEINVNFDFFAWRQGVVVKIFHTGKFAQNIQVKGSLKDGQYAKRIDDSLGIEEVVDEKKIRRKKVPKDRSAYMMSSTTFRRLFGVIYMILGLFMIFGRIIHWNGLQSVSSLISDILMVVVGIVSVVIGYVFARRLLPSKLSKGFYEG